MSEMAFLLMLALNRNFPESFGTRIKNLGTVAQKTPLSEEGRDPGSKVIGEEIARKCKAFGMTVFGMDIVRRRIESVDFFYGPEDLPQVTRLTI
jgi:phosphoglycerate dehydrogenase-like enzyme